MNALIDTLVGIAIVAVFSGIVIVVQQFHLGTAIVYTLMAISGLALCWLIGSIVRDIRNWIKLSRQRKVFESSWKGKEP